MPYSQEVNLPPGTTLYSPSGLSAYWSTSNIAGLGSIRAPETNTQFIAVTSYGSFGDLAHLYIRAGLEAWKMAEANSRWSKYVLNPLAETDVDTLTETVEATLDFIEEFGPERLSLQGIPYNFVQPEHLAALLRASSTWRDSVPGWSEALMSAATAVESAGGDPEDVLFGMV